MKYFSRKMLKYISILAFFLTLKLFNINSNIALADTTGVVQGDSYLSVLVTNKIGIGKYVPNDLVSLGEIWSSQHVTTTNCYP